MIDATNETHLLGFGGRGGGPELRPGGWGGGPELRPGGWEGRPELRPGGCGGGPELRGGGREGGFSEDPVVPPPSAAGSVGSTVRSD